MFNMGGYLLLFEYYISASDDLANEQISKGFYKPEELVEIKIPVRMPYVHEQLEYRNISGHLQLNGNCYNYVGLKMTRDTMYVRCVPNYIKTKLIGQKATTVKEAGETPLSKKSHSYRLKKTGTDDEFNCVINTFFLAPALKLQHNRYAECDSRFSDVYLSSPAQPPEFNA